MKKIVQDLQVEIESIKKTQVERKLEMKVVVTRTGNTGASFTEGIQRRKRVSPALKTAQKQWKPHRNYIRHPQMVTRKLHIHTLLRRKQLYKAQTVAEQTLRKMLEISIYLNYSLFVLFRKEKKSRNQILGTSIKNWSTTVSPFFFPEHMTTIMDATFWRASHLRSTRASLSEP